MEMIETLAPFLGKSPRAVKRFMNLYRLMRGRRRGAALDAFLAGGDGTPALFPAYQFWLALDTGVRAEDVALYRTALNRDALAAILPDALLDATAVATLDDLEKHVLATLRESLDAKTAARHATALQAVLDALPGDAGRQALLLAETEVQRFSLPARGGFRQSGGRDTPRPAVVSPPTPPRPTQQNAPTNE